METFIATALPIPIDTVLALAVVGAPVAVVPGAFVALVAVKTGTTGVILRDRPPEPLLPRLPPAGLRPVMCEIVSFTVRLH